MMIMMLAIFWLFQILVKKPKDQEEPVAPPTPTEMKTVDAPTPEESGELIGALPEEVRLLAGKETEESPTFHTLGSADPSSPYRMLVTLTNRGAAVTRIEMNERAFRDCFDKSGYLGQIIADETLAEQESVIGTPGLRVQTVGDGTPASKAGLVPGDRIVSFKGAENGESGGNGIVKIDSFIALREALLTTHPGETIELGVLKKERIDSGEIRLSTVPEEESKGETAGEAEGESTEEEKPTGEEIDYLALAEMVPVTLTEVPLSVIRPMGVIANYDDYKNLAGLQGKSYDYSNDYYDVNQRKDVFRRPNTDPTSFLLTLAEYDDQDRLGWPTSTKKKNGENLGRNNVIDQELPFYEISGDQLTPSSQGLRDGYWEFLEEESDATKAVFRKILPRRQLEIRKTYSLARQENEGEKKSDHAEEYHLEMTISLRNLDATKDHSVSYFLDGPTGLPVEDLWYSAGRKTGPTFGAYGLRDVPLKMDGTSFHLRSCRSIATTEMNPSDPVRLDFIGVDSQYFQATLIPNQEERNTPREYLPIRAGACLDRMESFTDVTFRTKSPSLKLAPAGQEGDTRSESFRIFVGPKKQKLLNLYGLGETLVYGWFWFISKPLSIILHFFRHYVVFHYGLAIILLTILVRFCLTPLTRKSIQSSIKMQQIQPELTALKERYQDNPQEMMKAQRELLAKNKVNPLGGCLPLFLQMPIFIGLYKVLSLDVDLYGAPLFTESFRWCSNLAAPDMMIDWSRMWNSIGWNGFNLGQGMFALGPYLNLLPIVTVAIFLIQQKVMMPPPSGTAQEQAQQKTMRVMMNFMMIFMGLMFFKVPSGLCVYFISSSLWGLLERKFQPKAATVVTSDAGGAGAAGLAAAPKVIDISANSQGNSGKSGKNSARRNRNRRPEASTSDAPKKKSWRELWAEVVEKAKEQQKLAKAEMEKRDRERRRRNR